jgi:hypothetical protein
MSAFDTNLLWRSTIGFDRLVDLIDSSMSMAEDNYPPYNIERTGEDSYHIELAVAGFAPDEISVTAEQNMLTVQGRKADKGDHKYLYQGISSHPPASIQAGRFRRGQGRLIQGRAPADPPGARGARGDEAASDRNRFRQCCRREQASRAPAGGLRSPSRNVRVSLRAAIRMARSPHNGGYNGRDRSHPLEPRRARRRGSPRRGNQSIPYVAPRDEPSV